MVLLPLSVLTLFLINGAVLLPHYKNYDYIYDDYVIDEPDPCDPSKCLLPKCQCFGKKPPGGLNLSDVPQFIMLTFDDAVTPVNMETYRTIEGKNSANGCPITLTFFVSHEYNDYTLVNELYQEGHEIAVHSISHESNTEMWKHANETRWRNEMKGMKTILNKMAQIPASEIVGHRAPFLQTAGDTTFRVLKDEGFLYDSSLPTRNNMDPPIWPYTLDYGYPQDCQIQPCPLKSYEGFWVFPMIQWKRTSATGAFYCSMLDACTPQPDTKSATLQYIKNNFERHYNSSKAPFPMFLHEAWLRNAEGKRSGRYEGLIEFLKEVTKKDDVFVVTMKEVLAYLEKPVKLSHYKTKMCPSERVISTDCENISSCHYPRRNRYMKTCTSCPKRYPWVANPEGK